MTNHDDRDEGHDWPDDDLTHQSPTRESGGLESEEREDDSDQLPVRHPPHRKPPPRKRGSYRPPSELDSE